MKKCFIALLMCALVIPMVVQAADWETLKKCTLAYNPSNDGDSFHVMYKSKEYYFRLYFVDTPETSKSFPARVSDQADYFEISDDHAIKLGKEASKFTKKALNKPFTVYTTWQNAKGGSHMTRHFAFVTTKSGDDLGELLIENGLARAYGARASHPKKPGIQQMWTRLRAAEKKAMQKKRGGWRRGW